MIPHDELLARMDKAAIEWKEMGVVLGYTIEEAAAAIRDLQTERRAREETELRRIDEYNILNERIVTERKAAESALAKCFEALQVLVELKQMKRKIEAGTAEVSVCDYYRANKETAWVNAEAAIRALKSDKQS